jgi:hypothetical protein
MLILLRKAAVILLAIILTISFLIGFSMLVNPLRRPTDSVKSWLLKQTPPGSTMEEVIELIEERGWRIDRINEIGYSSKYDDTLDRSIEEYTVGVKSIKAIVEYKIVFKTDVSMSWGFDEEGKLIDIGVRKYTDTI